MKISINGLWVSSISEDFKEVKYTDDKDWALNIKEVQFAKLILQLVESGQPTYANEVHLIQEEKKVNFDTIGEILKSQIKMDFKVKQFKNPRLIKVNQDYVEQIFPRSWTGSTDKKDAQKFNNLEINHFLEILSGHLTKWKILQDNSDILEIISHEQK